MNPAMPTYAATPMMPNMMSGVAQMPMMPPMPCKYNIYGLALEITVLTPYSRKKNICIFIQSPLRPNVPNLNRQNPNSLEVKDYWGLKDTHLLLV